MNIIDYALEYIYYVYHTCEAMHAHDPRNWSGLASGKCYWSPASNKGNISNQTAAITETEIV